MTVSSCTIDLHKAQGLPGRCTITAYDPAESARQPSSADTTVERGTKFLTSPLLISIPIDGQILLAVGTAHVFHDEMHTYIELMIRQMWVADEAHHEASNWRSANDGHFPAAELMTWCTTLLTPVPSEIVYATVHLAKALASGSRDTVEELRRHRYFIESRFGGHLRGATKSVSLEALLADVIELSSIASRVRDEARATVREGLKMWRNDEAAYHAQRRLLDPTLPARPLADKAMEQPWFSLYDAAIRQVINLRIECEEEVQSLTSLLGAGSSIAAARDASAQELFNLLAAVGGVAFGLPALILALYSATAILPFDSLQHARVLIPVLIAGIISIAIAVRLPGEMGKKKRFWWTFGSILVTLSVLALAGWLAPPRLS